MASTAAATLASTRPMVPSATLVEYDELLAKLKQGKMYTSKVKSYFEAEWLLRRRSGRAALITPFIILGMGLHCRWLRGTHRVPLPVWAWCRPRSVVQKLLRRELEARRDGNTTWLSRLPRMSCSGRGPTGRRRGWRSRQARSSQKTLTAAAPQTTAGDHCPGV